MSLLFVMKHSISHSESHIARNIFKDSEGNEKQFSYQLPVCVCARQVKSRAAYAGSAEDPVSRFLGLLLVNFPTRLIRKTSIHHLFTLAPAASRTDSALFVAEPSLRHNRRSAWQ